jgi:hypothetical protein
LSLRMRVSRKLNALGWILSSCELWSFCKVLKETNPQNSQNDILSYCKEEVSDSPGLLLESC